MIIINSQKTVIEEVTIDPSETRTWKKSAKIVKDKTFSWDLVEGWEEDLDTYKRTLTQLQVNNNDVFKVKLSCTLKIHIIVSHLKPFLRRLELA